jgi:hypothetical protein
MRAARTAVLSLLLVPAAAAAQSTHLDPGRQRVHRAVEAGPLRFEANQGQTDQRVKFLARVRGYRLFLTEAEAVFSFPNGRSEADSQLRLQFLGMRRPESVTGETRLAAITNYLKGPGRDWKTGIPNFARVRYAGVYDGVDIVYYGNERHLEYDFILSPGAKASAITLRWSGARGLRVESNGDLLFRVGSHELRQPKPVAFQIVDGKRRDVAADYTLQRDGRVGFRLGPYDTSLALTIDPVLLYSTYLGGTGELYGAQTIAVDVNGAAYVGGLATAADFPTTPGSLRETANPGSLSCTVCDGFVTKFDAAGAVVYSTFVGGHGTNSITGIVVDRYGQTYLTGHTTAPDFPTTDRAFQRECVRFDGTVPLAGYCSVGFVAKLNTTGSSLVFSTYLGGAATLHRGSGTMLSSLAVDNALNVYVTGATGPAFPVTPGAAQTVHPGTFFTGVVAKLNGDGRSLAYATYLGGTTDSDLPAAIAVDPAGNAFVSGQAGSRDFPITPGAFQPSCKFPPQIEGNCATAFVTKIDPTGRFIVYSTFLGEISTARDVAVDGDGFAYITGHTYNSDFPTTPSNVKRTPWTRDAFVTKLNRDGTAVVYSTYLGGDAGDWVGGGFEEGHGIAIDAEGNAYVVGATGSLDFPGVAAIQGTYGGGSRDAYVAKLNPSGTELLFSTLLGGAGDDHAYAVAVDAAGDIFVAGSTGSADFPVVSAAQPLFPGGERPAFVARIGEPPSCGADATSSVQVFQSAYLPLFWPFTLQFVVVQNVSPAPLSRPVAYVMDDLQNAAYVGSVARTHCVSPEGDPFQLVPLGGDNVLAPNEAVVIALWFIQNRLAPITYTASVLSEYRGR